MAIKEKATAEKIVKGIPVDEIRTALINEYKRRLIRYKMVDEAMRNKYGMDFNKFESGNVIKKKKFSWDVESDGMEWEHALEGIRYAEQKLEDLENR